MTRAPLELFYVDSFPNAFEEDWCYHFKQDSYSRKWWDSRGRWDGDEVYRSRPEFPRAPFLLKTPVALRLFPGAYEYAVAESKRREIK